MDFSSPTRFLNTGSVSLPGLRIEWVDTKGLLKTHRVSGFTTPPSPQLTYGHQIKVIICGIIFVWQTVKRD